MAKNIDFIMFQGIAAVFLIMYRNTNHQKVPPRQILKRDFSRAMSKISFHHKDAIGREN